MDGKRVRILIGAAMVALGLVQAGLFAVQSERVGLVLGLVYSGIGVAYLWAEVVAVDR